MVHKFENPARVAELDPANTLKKIGLDSSDVFCDVGAGTGIFAFAAAHITANTVYAVDVSDGMLDILRARKESLVANNVRVLKSVGDVPPDSCDVILLCAVLHEMVDRTETLRAVKAIAKPNGLLAVIEFHKELPKFGPPMELRMDEEQTSTALSEAGFCRIQRFDLGENFYCVVFENSVS